MKIIMYLHLIKAQAKDGRHAHLTGELEYHESMVEATDGEGRERRKKRRVSGKDRGWKGEG